jgi:hypothetical protein
MPGPATAPSTNLDSARSSGLAKMVLGAVAAAGFSFAGGLYGRTFIFLTPTPGPAGRPGGRYTHCWGTKMYISIVCQDDSSPNRKVAAAAWQVPGQQVPGRIW